MVAWHAGEQVVLNLVLQATVEPAGRGGRGRGAEVRRAEGGVQE